MRRRILAVSALLVVLAACRDRPAELTAPVEAGAGFTASAEIVTAVVDLLNDAFVRELMNGARARTDVLDGAVQDASRYGTPDDIEALSRALTDTRSRLVPSEDDAEEGADEVILRAALTLMLDDALMLLEKGPTLGEEKKTLEAGNTETRSIER